MHEFFGANAVLDAAEQAQQAAADHYLKAFGTTAPPASDTTAGTDTGTSGVAVYPPGDKTVVVAPASPTTTA